MGHLCLAGHRPGGLSSVPRAPGAVRPVEPPVEAQELQPGGEGDRVRPGTSGKRVGRSVRASRWHLVPRCRLVGSGRHRVGSGKGQRGRGGHPGSFCRDALSRTPLIRSSCTGRVAAPPALNGGRRAGLALLGAHAAGYGGCPRRGVWGVTRSRHSRPPQIGRAGRGHLRRAPGTHGGSADRRATRPVAEDGHVTQLGAELLFLLLGIGVPLGPDLQQPRPVALSRLDAAGQFA